MGVDPDSLGDDFLSEVVAHCQHMSGVLKSLGAYRGEAKTTVLVEWIEGAAVEIARYFEGQALRTDTNPIYDLLRKYGFAPAEACVRRQHVGRRFPRGRRVVGSSRRWLLCVPQKNGGPIIAAVASSQELIASQFAAPSSAWEHTRCQMHDRHCRVATPTAWSWPLKSAHVARSANGPISVSVHSSLSSASNFA
jgi:hypothetical protein